MLRWPIESPTGDYDQVIQTEDLLREELMGGSEVDGHDLGSGEMNIFLLTDDPTATFEAVRRILERGPAWATVRIAYRVAQGGRYTILWPEDLTEFRVA